MKKRIESEKNKFLADSAFVLRKYEDFIKAQQEVTKAQHNYNRISGYAKEEENGEYWKNQLPYHQKAIDEAKVLVAQAIENLAQKGVNVAEIEHQTKANCGVRQKAGSIAGSVRKFGFSIQNGKRKPPEIK